MAFTFNFEINGPTYDDSSRISETNENNHANSTIAPDAVITTASSAVSNSHPTAHYIYPDICYDSKTISFREIEVDGIILKIPNMILDDSQFHDPSCMDVVLQSDSDIVKGVYEGGFKVWECSLDLAKIIGGERLWSESNNRKQHVGNRCQQGIESPETRTTITTDKGNEFNYDTAVTIGEGSNHFPKRIVEFGCGAACPSIVALMKFDNIEEMILCDFNDDVLTHLTYPGVLLNVGEMKSNVVKYIAGTWDHSLSILLNGKFDLIITAETLYTEDSTQDIFRLIEKHLSFNGIALIASKKYYFGVGGGTFHLQNLLNHDDCQLKCEILQSYEDMKTNIREVLKITWKKLS